MWFTFKCSILAYHVPVLKWTHTSTEKQNFKSGVPILRGAQYVSKRLHLSWWGNTVYAFLFRANRENNKLGSWNPCSKNYVALNQSNAKIMFYLINALKRAKEKKIQLKISFFDSELRQTVWLHLRRLDRHSGFHRTSRRRRLAVPQDHPWDGSRPTGTISLIVLCISNKNLALVFLTGPANGDFLNILNLT